MRKGLKITAWILGLLAILLLAGLVAIQSPAVQTALGKRIVGIIQKNTDADIQFGGISIRPLEAIILKDLVVRDKKPALPQLDTILYVDNLSVKFSLRGLLNGSGIHVSRLRLIGGGFNLITEPDPIGPERMSPTWSVPSAWFLTSPRRRRRPPGAICSPRVRWNWRTSPSGWRTSRWP